MGVCGNVCCVAAVVEHSVSLALYVFVSDVMDVLFSVCTLTRGAVGARVWYL